MDAGKHENSENDLNRSKEAILDLEESTLGYLSKRPTEMYLGFSGSGWFPQLRFKIMILQTSVREHRRARKGRRALESQAECRRVCSRARAFGTVTRARVQAPRRAIRMNIIQVFFMKKSQNALMPWICSWSVEVKDNEYFACNLASFVLRKGKKMSWVPLGLELTLKPVLQMWSRRHPKRPKLDFSNCLGKLEIIAISFLGQCRVNFVCRCSVRPVSGYAFPKKAKDYEKHHVWSWRPHRHLPHGRLLSCFDVWEKAMQVYKPVMQNEGIKARKCESTMSGDSKSKPQMQGRSLETVNVRSKPVKAVNVGWKPGKC
ncbi:hypothetical protein CRG98_019872 [Punica granatum]|uniref:Uncharacterized protein n=1 Tax=Punica granatum TaxID=22663 RepID=A0A2I0JW47_PUNGR|nr:hypothetical protein CRG98_019872 [Punica granatum]